MPISPATARNRLSKRRAWLIARAESCRATGTEKPTYFLDEEIEALDYVLGILNAMGGMRNGGAVADEAERVQRARDVQAERQKRCSCERCPVHGAPGSGKTAQ